MAPGALGCLRALAVSLVACAACGKGKVDDKAEGTKPPPSAADLDLRCEQLAKACGDQPKHVDKISDECKLAATKQHGCIDKGLVLVGCYEHELCGSGEKVWTMEDLRVLAERHGKCVAERDAIRACTDK